MLTSCNVCWVTILLQVYQDSFFFFWLTFQSSQYFLPTGPECIGISQTVPVNLESLSNTKPVVIIVNIISDPFISLLKIFLFFAEF